MFCNNFDAEATFFVQSESLLLALITIYYYYFFFFRLKLCASDCSLLDHVTSIFERHVTTSLPESSSIHVIHVEVSAKLVKVYGRYGFESPSTGSIKSLHNTLDTVQGPKSVNPPSFWAELCPM